MNDFRERRKKYYSGDDITRIYCSWFFSQGISCVLKPFIDSIFDESVIKDPAVFCSFSEEIGIRETGRLEWVELGSDLTDFFRNRYIKINVLRLHFIGVKTNNLYNLYIYSDDMITPSRIIKVNMTCTLNLGDLYQKVIDGEKASKSEMLSVLAFKEELFEVQRIFKCDRIMAWNDKFQLTHEDVEPESLYFDIRSDGDCKTIFV